MPFLESLVRTAFSTISSWNSNIANNNTNSYLGQKWKWPFKNTNSNAKNVVQWLSTWEPRFNTQDCWRTHYLAEKTSSPANRATTFFYTTESIGILSKERESREGFFPILAQPFLPGWAIRALQPGSPLAHIGPLGDPLWSCQKQKFQSDSLVGFIGNTTCCKEYS